MTGAASVEHPSPTHAEFALEKLTRVLGRERALRIYRDTLAGAGLADIRTADDLHAFGQHLSTCGGFEAAVGGMLSVAALLRGATGHRR
jgi:hypothetical protein